MTQSCEGCKFSLLIAERPDQVFCRRYPPTVLPRLDGDLGMEFPQMKLHGWCGEYRAKIYEIGARSQ